MLLSLLSFFFCNTAWAATLPEANLTVSPATGEIAKEFSFDASASTNTQGRRGGLEYRFQFASGRAWTDWSSRSVVKFTPMDIGTERVRLQVRERNSRSTQATYRTYRVVGDIYRKAWISVRPTTIKAGETAYFELKVTLPRTEDKDKVQARWDFDSDGHFETSYSRQKIVPHIYSFNEVGQVSPTVEVKFEDGTIKRIRGIENISSKGASIRKTMLRKTWPKVRITSPEVVAPIVNVSPGKNGYTEDTAFRFDATLSRVPAHAWLEWSFEGGVYIKGQKILVKKFQSPGNHEIRVRTCYNRAAPKCAETILTVNTKEDPIDYRAEMRVTNKTRSASFSSGQDKKSFFKAVVGDTIRFGAQIKQSGGGSGGYTYRWDFEGDGTWDTPFSTRSSIEHMYSRFGSYEPRLQVQNKDLIPFQESVKLQVVPSSAPHGNFTVDKRYIYVGEKVRFFPKVNDSQSPRSKIQVRFDVDGDGKWDNRFRNLTSFEWRFTEPGQYIARMQTKDQSGKVVTILRSVTVYPYDKTRTQALVKVSSRYGDTKTKFVFDASDSIGRDLQYVWDFDYKGTNDIISKGARVKTATSKITKQFSSPGEKQVSLRVIDGDGNENMIHFPVWVSLHVLKADPVNPQSNPTPNSTYQNREVPLDSYEKRVSASQWYPGYEPNGVKEHPLEARPDIRVTYRYMKQKNGNISFPDRELSRAGMFYFMYEPYLAGVTFKLQEASNNKIPVFVYGAQRGMILPGNNPFSDVTKQDWFYQAALLSYRDRLSTAPFFRPSLTVSSHEASTLVAKVTGWKVDFGLTVTREEFRSALGN